MERVTSKLIILSLGLMLAAFPYLLAEAGKGGGGGPKGKKCKDSSQCDASKNEICNPFTGYCESIACSSNADCAKYPGLMCNTTYGVCAPVPCDPNKDPSNPNIDCENFFKSDDYVCDQTTKLCKQRQCREHKDCSSVFPICNVPKGECEKCTTTAQCQEKDSSLICHVGSCTTPPTGTDPCGDGTCDPATETCSNCEKDCGVCPPPPTGGPVCGNGACESGEDCVSCAVDCGGCPSPTGCNPPCAGGCLCVNSGCYKPTLPITPCP